MKIARGICYTFKTVLVFPILIFFFSSCDETFVPLEDKSQAPFSMYGFLDASADTQWVRIIPIRDQLETFPEIPDMIVTIENIETGERSVLNDSLFQLRQGFNIINSWSTIDIQHEQTYRLKGELPNGLTSSVTITIPRDFPFPDTSNFSGSAKSGVLNISGIETLADVKAVWHIRFYFDGRMDQRVIAIPYRRRVESYSNGEHSVYINCGRELAVITDQTLTSPDSVDVLSRKIFVASAGPEWNEEVTSLEQLEYALPQINSNVENGLGYMIGIVSKTVELSHCF